ncbi:tniQ family protein (plasmid) [Burkholderia pseudomallei]|uniref:TniQ family protein n=1 Tax=Burkholderia pseudomallei TaxID=28450 RepID=UPI00050F7D7D|nr:TniQ family protein [Burkholderia pseudomallei]AIV73791.1 tniQ family protein [Burkholderia pseudomallei]KGD55103.1 tniQ family protein [Burkholderia pseudomallei]
MLTDLRPWPVAPRPFDEGAFGSWLGRIASRYALSISQLWETSQPGRFPALTNAGWILFAPLPEDTLKIFATLARVEIGHLVRIQTPSDWMTDRAQLPYCFRCLVVNPVDVTAPRWKQRWLDPDIKVCEEHGDDLEHIPASMPRQAKNMDRLLSNISKYRRRRSEALWYRRY